MNGCELIKCSFYQDGKCTYESELCWTNQPDEIDNEKL